jgi:hypothetical protein
MLPNDWEHCSIERATRFHFGYRTARSIRRMPRPRSRRQPVRGASTVSGGISGDTCGALSELVHDLSAPLAIPLDEYLRTDDPYRALHAMCGALDLVMRFLSVTALAVVRSRQTGAELPEPIARSLVQHLARRPPVGRASFTVGGGSGAVRVRDVRTGRELLADAGVLDRQRRAVRSGRAPSGRDRLGGRRSY